MCQALQMGEADKQSKYLGLPNILGRNKSVILGYLKDKVKTRIQSWDGKFIARAGKETLIKSVAQALPTYAMNVFLLPVEITKDIERSLTKYWWDTGQSNGSRISWMSWDRMTKHKNAGGLGFRDFKDFNLAMLGKQGWRFLTNPNNLVSRVYKAIYFKDTSFLHSSLGSSPSFIWRSIIAAKDVVSSGVRWRIGTGESIQILGQPWLTDKVNPFITTASQSIENTTVKSLMCVDKKEWDMEVVCDIFNVRDQNCILNIHL